ncbi:hypothetical protein P175DRAFT_022927 [Aspergillus ochraceoroseus IBT 24754]|uniref:Uncharacterized protein n=1 Tax=Aspergillus ochraceoroseus IBT 24754 TaxID=1392256 RepID=A0A2T5M6P5_9EURO|nr:uncharacterized protein P175DRAFT_022927 [Aspergillus ochraceoroseus IBT 24754]PTU24202.1 hypothetical protein P175DRAFT_022927 [Aspergillus ochraceoroseus IBT 24754]
MLPENTSGRDNSKHSLSSRKPRKVSRCKWLLAALGSHPAFLSQTWTIGSSTIRTRRGNAKMQWLCAVPARPAMSLCMYVCMHACMPGLVSNGGISP